MAALRTVLCWDISTSSNKRKTLTTWRHSASRGLDELSKELPRRLHGCWCHWIFGWTTVLADSEWFGPYWQTSTCHYLTIEIRWDPGGLTDISSFCQTAYNFNTGHVIQLH